MTEQRHSPVRRQFNQAFCAPDGSFSITKTIAIFAQIAALYYFGKDFDHLIDKPESLAIVLAFLVAPDLLKKLLVLKFGGTSERKNPITVRQGEAAG